MKTIYIKLFFALGVINLIVLLFFFGRTSPSFGLIDQDESPYIFTSQNFVANNYCGAATIINENVAKIGEADWYGVFYPSFYGGIMKFLPKEKVAYIFINLLFFCSIFIIIYFSKQIDTESKWLLGSLLLLFPTFLHYTFYFMPIALNCLFAISILILLINIYSDFSTRKLVLLVLLIIIATLFRPTFIFLLFTLLPLFSKPISILLMLALILCAIIFTNVYTLLFTAPPYAESLKATEFLFQLRFIDFFKGLCSAFGNNIVNGPLNYKGIHSFELFTYYFTLLSPIYFTIVTFKKDRLVFAIALGCLATNLALAFLYTLYPHFFIRISVPITLLMLYCLVTYPFKKKEYTILFVLMILTLSTLRYNKYQLMEFAERKVSNTNIKALEGKLKPLNELLQNQICSATPITVLVDYSLLIKYKPHILLSALPHITTNKNTIRYTTNIHTPDRLELHSKIIVDFILTTELLPENEQRHKLLNTEEMNLYEIYP